MATFSIAHLGYTRYLSRLAATYHPLDPELAPLYQLGYSVLTVLLFVVVVVVAVARVSHTMCSHLSRLQPWPHSHPANPVTAAVGRSEVSGILSGATEPTASDPRR
jgi:hypothetical protein